MIDAVSFRLPPRPQPIAITTALGASLTLIAHLAIGSPTVATSHASNPPLTREMMPAQNKTPGPSNAMAPTRTQAGSASTGSAGSRALVRVPVSDSWTATGLHLEQGDRVTIRAWGTIVVDKSTHAQTLGPGGAPPSGRGCEHLLLDEGAREGALVADVAPASSLAGAGFTVGTRWNGTTPMANTTASTGELFLGINHRHMACDRSGYDSWALRNDSSGAFTAEVTVSRRK